jgi:hypothetical protein
VAFDGTNFLVAWMDIHQGRADIFGARLTPAGRVLDPAGFPIAQAPRNQTYPVLAFGGTNFLVVWEDERSGFTEVFAARVSRGGLVLDPAGIRVGPEPTIKPEPEVAFDGTNFLVVWMAFRAGKVKIIGARVSPGGTVLDPAGIAISPVARDQFSPALAFDGTNFLVVWQDLRPGAFGFDIFGARVSPAGEVLDPVGIPISQVKSAGLPAVTFAGSSSLVVWVNLDATHILGARVSRSGAVLDPAGIVISPIAYDQFAPAVAFDGTNFLVVWADAVSGRGANIFGARVGAGGAVIDAAGIPISEARGNQLAPAVAFDGESFLVVWEDSRTSGVGSSRVDIFGARVDAGGAVLDPGGIPISQAPDAQLAPAVASDGTNSLVVWQDLRSPVDNNDIFGARVGPGGAVLDPGGIRVSPDPNNQLAPAVASDGTSYLVVWEDLRFGPVSRTDIFAARVSAGGVVLDPAGVRVTHERAHESAPAVASGGTSFLVVWKDIRSDIGDIFGTRMSPAGAVLDPAGIPISQAPDEQSLPAVAFNGSFLVVWRDRRRGASHDTFGARVRADGSVQDTSGFVIAGSADDEGAPAVVTGTADDWAVPYDRGPLGHRLVALRIVSAK